MSLESTPPPSGDLPTPSHPNFSAQAENLIVPDGIIDRETAEQFQDLFSSHNSTAPPPPRRSSTRKLLMILPLLSISAAITLAPRIEIYNLLVCSVYRPDLFDLEPNGVNSSLLAANGTMSFPHYTNFVANDSTSNGIVSYNAIFESLGTSQDDECATDPVVRTAVAKLTAVITATSGLLMCITTGWWGSFSDRHGRKLVIILATCSTLVTDFNFILGNWLLNSIPGGYWALLIGPVVEGIFGGITVAMLTNQSYISDSTSESERAAAFSLALGLIYTGMAIGPTIGSLAIHYTGRLLSVFYLSALLHTLYAALVFIIVPESISAEQMKEFRAIHSERGIQLSDTSLDEQSVYTGIRRKIRSLFAFLEPLSVFLPYQSPNNFGVGKKARKDWSLTMLITGYAFMISVAGSYTYKFQYATSTFHWSAETLGYWLSLIGAARALHLALFVPLIIKFFKPADSPHVPSAEVPNTNLPDSDSTTPLLAKDASVTHHSSSFDLKVAKYSLVMDFIAFAGMGLAQSSLIFGAFGISGSLGISFTPAADAVMLTLYLRRGGTETGKLLGAVGLVQAFATQVAGPGFFGLVYMATVATHPRVIFVCSVSIVALAFALVSFVRLPRGDQMARESVDDAEELRGDL